MFRRSLLAFLAFVMLVLALIVGYAMTGLSGPETAIEEAGRAVDAGHHHEAINILEMAERDLGPSGQPELRRTILMLRSKAHLATGNPRQALVDLEKLSDVHAIGDVAVLHELIRVLIVLGHADQALERARAHLRDSPGDGRTLELAGEAAQANYQADLKLLLADLASKLSPAHYRQAVEALRPYLYRRGSDPRSQLGKSRFDEILKNHRREAYVAGLYRPAIDRIREQIQIAQRYFRDSLQAGGTPVSAYQGMAFALMQGKRGDDVIALSEAYLRRFEHEYTTEAAINLARVHFENGRNAAAVAAVERFLPSGTLRTRIEARTVNPSVRRLLLLKGRALHAMGDAEGLALLASEIRDVVASGILDPGLQLPLIEAYHETLAGSTSGVENILGPYVWHRGLKDAPTSGDDYLVEAMKLRIAAAEGKTARIGHYQNICKTWIEKRPGDPEPFRLRAGKLLRHGQGADALPDARTYMQLAGHDDEALRLYAGALDASLSASARDAAALLQECLQLNRVLPREISDSVMFLPLAELAMQKKEFGIASAAAGRASQLYTWAKWPRYLVAEAALERGLPEDAVRAMETLREYHPDDQRALTLLRRARAETGADAEGLLYEIAVAGEPDESVAAALLRNCMKRRDWIQAGRFAKRIAGVYGESVEVRIMVADTMVATGNPGAARQLLLPMFEPLQSRNHPAAGDVARRVLALEAEAGHPNSVETIARVARELHRDDSDALYAMAKKLARWRHHAPALAMLEPLLEDPAHDTRRKSEHFLLAGQLALALADPKRAENHFMAALALDDDTAAQRPLAMLLLSADRVAEAEDALLDPAVNDQASAALQIRLGHPEAALEWIQSRLQENGADLAARCLRYTIDPGQKPPPVVEAHRELLLELLIYNEVAGFEDHALELADELVAAYPDDPMVGTLRGHSLARAGRDSEALDALMAIAKDGNYPSAWDEIVRILTETDPARLDEPEILAGASEVVRVAKTAAPPRLRALSLRALATNLSATGNPAEQAKDLLTTLWTEFAEETRAGLGEFEAMLGFGRNEAALSLLDRIEGRLSEEDRPAFLSVFAQRALELSRTTANEELRGELIRRARTLLARDGAYGGFVHMILEQQDHTLGALPARRDEAVLERIENERMLLEQHLADFRRGLDSDVDTLVATMRRFGVLESTEEVLGRIHGMLRWDPSLVGLWIHRADVLEKSGRPTQALDGLRWLFHYTHAPEVLLAYGRVAGQSGVVTPADDVLIQRMLDAETSKTPQAAYVLGIIALRMARYAQAVSLLGDASPRPDGAHLFYRALAYLASSDAGAAAQASALLAEFETDYPHSGVSEVAGNVSRQLALDLEQGATTEPTLPARPGDHGNR